jgi:outer membrane receptor for ferrienterochelin and colicin
MTIRQHDSIHAVLPSLRKSVLVLAISISTAYAQSDESSDSTIIYPAAFFDQYTPVSANDMITRIPGVSIDSRNSNNNNNNSRGLGSGGDLLINGKRIAGKDNSASSQLSRIAANQVERIEIIRGSSAELDVRGAGQVVNIVLKDAQSRSSVSAEVSMDYHLINNEYDPGGSLSYGGQNGNLDYLFHIKMDPRYNVFGRKENSYSPGLTQTGRMTEDIIRDEGALETSINLGYEFERDRIQINALVSDNAHPAELTRNLYSASDLQNPFRTEQEINDNDHNNWEIGGNHEHRFANNSRFQSVFVVNDSVRNDTRERFTIEGINDSTKTQYLQSDSRTRERIGQATYSWSLSSRQDMQLGFERAQTILDTQLFLGSNTANGSPLTEYGNLPSVPGASNPGSTVEEMRYESFAVHNWILNDRMTLESTLLYEMSSIEQSGTVQRSRDFEFLRPKVDYRFDINPATQIRATVERKISQLSFQSFTATVNNQDLDKDTIAGNPDLVQEQEMNYELSMEYRLPNDGGVLTSRLFYRDIDDVIGRVNISSDPANPISATGNLGNGKRYGINLDVSTRLGIIGLPEAVFTSSINLFDSYVFDPILGEDRRFNGRGRASIGFRHDIPALGLNYGFDFNRELPGGEINVDVDNLERTVPHDRLNLYVSKVAFDNITFRLESTNALNDAFCRERLRFNGTPSLGLLEEIEKSCAAGAGHKVALKIRTTF